jgi:hypothetical protein
MIEPMKKCVHRVPGCHLGDLCSNLGLDKFLQRGMALLRPTHNSIPCSGVKTGRETPNQIRVWSFIHKKLFSLRNCHVTVNSEAIACARRCQSSRLTVWWTRKE